jgi:hypothetical protein
MGTCVCIQTFVYLDLLLGVL